jgi:ABC-2 type transport system permease protein
MPIFDQGYQHWNGELSGHGWRWWAITRHGVRVGLKNRFLRYVLFAAWTPALALATILSLWGLLERKSETIMQFLGFLASSMITDPLKYRVDVWRVTYGYFMQVELYLSMVLILMVGPSLISMDLRFNALPLYFSRPMRRIDYFLGKLGVIVVFLGMVTVGPAIVAYILGLLFSLDITIIRDTFGTLLRSVAFGLIIAVSGGLLVLALSTLSRNSRNVALMWLGLWFLTKAISSVLQAADADQRAGAYYREVSIPPPPPALRSDPQAWRERDAQMREWRRKRNHAEIQHRMDDMDFSKQDWRPLVSYEADLLRVGQALMRTNETWDRLSLLMPEGDRRDRLIITWKGSQHPWTWSAGVLLGLFGLSACVLNLSVKSLDRLK